MNSHFEIIYRLFNDINDDCENMIVRSSQFHQNMMQVISNLPDSNQILSEWYTYN